MANFNRSEIFKAAWAIYRSIRARYAPWQIERGIIDGSFSHALKRAWDEAKAEAVANERLAVIKADPAAASLAHQIDMLEFKSSRSNIAVMRASLTAQLDQLIPA
jgi:hypothetical protein